MNSARAKRIDIISDTHGYLSPALLDELKGADLIIHAGDPPGGPKKYFQKSCCAPDRLLCILIPAAHASGNKRERLPGELAQFG